MSDTFPFLFHLEAPTPDTPATGHSVLLRGWLIVGRDVEVAGPFVEQGGRRHALRPTERRDVEAHFDPDDRVIGFDELVHATSAAPWYLAVEMAGVTYRTALPVPVDPTALASFGPDKVAKLERIEPLLRCPRPRPRRNGTDTSCGGQLRRHDGELRCRRCRARYPASGLHVDFLTDELRVESAIEDTTNVSTNFYPEPVLEMIDELADGLILDNGAGLRHEYYRNVVNFDVVPYPTTDVLGVGERLPFASESFDALISIVVLEHVRDPFRCAAEIARVLKPGGRLYAAVPFLQPYHGYPSHYFNMTHQGLERLFSDDFDIEESTVPRYGLPISTLTWFLRSYLAGLPDDARRHLEEMRVKDLTGRAMSYWSEDFVRELSPDATRELACVNAIVATKRRVSS